MGSDKETARKRRRTDFVKKNMDRFQRPATHDSVADYKRKPKNQRPVHEIDIDDDYLDEEEIWRD